MKTAFTLAIASILSITASFAQQGNMKFSGLIVDEKNETQLTMITLYQINSGKGEVRKWLKETSGSMFNLSLDSSTK